MAERSKGWTLWSRSGYRGPSESMPRLPGGAEPAGREPAGPDPHGATQPAPGQARRPQEGPPGALRDGSLIDRIIAERSVQVEYQPVHDSERRQVVGFEALSRGPEGPLRSPLALFAAARAAGRLGELDWVCRAAAFQGMLDAGLPPSVSLFVNAEADSLIEPCPPALLPTVLEAERKLRVFVDLSGRALSRYPCQALETARRARAASWGVAINEIEFSAAGTALLPTLEPDVVKLNHQLIAGGLGQANAAMMAAIGECDRSGAALLIERVEDDTAALIARAVGATYQQGHKFGKPGPLPAHLPVPLAPVPLLQHGTGPALRTPWQLLVDNGARHMLNIDQAGLDELITATATVAGPGDQPPVVAVVSPMGAAMPAARRAMFAMLLERCPLIIVLGEHVSTWSDWRVRAADLTAGHPLAHESCFLVLSPRVTMAVAARTRHPQQPGATWDLAISQSPDLCRTVMRELLAHVDLLEGGVHHPG